MAINKNIVERWRKSEIVVLGGSAGSFKILYTAVRAFPSDIGKAVLIVIHRKRNFLSEIEELFGNTSHLKVKKILDKVPLQKNTIMLHRQIIIPWSKKPGTLALMYLMRFGSQNHP